MNMEQNKNSVDDYVTGLSKDILSYLIFTFFPTSTRHFRFRETFSRETTLDAYKTSKHHIGTGSLPENLELPILVDANREYVLPDWDRLLVHEGSDVIVLTDGIRPGYCQLIQKSDNTRMQATFYGDCIKLMFANHPVLRKEVCDVSAEKVSIPYGANEDRSTFYTPAQDYSFMDDLVVAISIPVPLEISMDFLERIENKQWPLYAQAAEWITECGCHAIPKANPFDNTGNDWRLSFSLLEVKLARTLNETQRTCYKVLKAAVMSEINETALENEKLASYFLKTTLFWLCEEIHPDLFVQTNMADIWIALLDKIIHSVSEGNIKNYFVPDCNLIQHIPTSVHKKWLVKLHRIRMFPLESFAGFWRVFTLNTYVCDLGGWPYYYGYTMDLISISTNDKHKPLMERKIANHILTFFLVDSNLTDWKRCVDFCQTLSASGSSTIIEDFHDGNILSYILSSHLNFITRVLEKPLDREDLSLLADLASYLHQLLITDPTFFFPIPEEMLYEAAVSNRRSIKVHSVPVVKYANYLRSKGKYEELVRKVTECLPHCDWEEKHLCIYSEYTPDILDEYMRLILGNMPEISFRSELMLYYQLLLGYQKAGVLAEVFMPGYFISEDKQKYHNLFPDFGIVWASLLCHAGFYDSAFLCCFCVPIPEFLYMYLEGILIRFMYKCIAELYLQLRDEHKAPSEVFGRQLEVRRTWSGAMMDFQRRFSWEPHELSKREPEELTEECMDILKEFCTDSSSVDEI